MKPKHADDGMYCPLWRSPCVKVCHTCELWDHITGNNPQTGHRMEHWACTMKMQTYLSIENTGALRQVTEHIDKLSQEVKSANDSGMASALSGLNAQVRRMEMKQLPGDGRPPQQLLEG